MKVLVTGSAGFVGAHLLKKFRENTAFELYGLDIFNDYYDVRLKRARVKYLTPGIRHFEVDIADAAATQDLFANLQPDVVVHLAAQAGVRHSFNQPMDYASSNLVGQVSVLEAIRSTKNVRRLIYASSSSVYSGVSELPFSEDKTLGTPKSLYAASKVAGEVLADTYARLTGVDMVGLRFFTVYGPWGRPDMAYWLFSDAILKERAISLFNHGNVKRDFTYIDDITESILRMAQEVESGQQYSPSHRVYNIGNHSSEQVQRMISILEQNLGAKAFVEGKPLPPGDMVETFADVARLQRDYGFSPDTTLEKGLTAFTDWFLKWREGAYPV